MKEKLTIENFAGIDYLELELNQINILIGPQASGKSISAKLFYYFKGFFDEIKKGVLSELLFDEVKERFSNKFIKYFPIENWPKNSFYLRYTLNNYYIEYMGPRNYNFENPQIIFSDDYYRLFKDAENNYKKIKASLATSNFNSNDIYDSFVNSFFSVLENRVKNKFSYTQFFIPSQRSLFSTIQEKFFTFYSNTRKFDPFLSEFGSSYEQIKPSELENLFILDSDRKNELKQFNKLLQSILKSNYIRNEMKDYLIHENNRAVNLSSASSGQQESLPLLLFLRYILKLHDSFNNSIIYIEEPEAHLYPNSQKLIVKLLSRIINSETNKFQIFITTHSPYILSSFNNLMYAGSLVNTTDEEKKKDVYKIIPKSEIINPRFVSAYSLKLGGKKKNLINRSTGLIAQNALDDVSNKISIEFGKLLDLED